ncbi:MAG: metal ABC transporter permease [Candidatus Acetothermia bacterium]|jgi:ABC-type Mn2+/Zn2+ transport system permease subunit|nr:metal ABC transporter permease [Candidatus Acetothermia bacterium]MDH7504546.1 metal ABC transporter permease [Candidatus Acetothermia bacterium]
MLLGIFSSTLVGAILAGWSCGLVGAFVVRLNLSSLGFTMSHAAFAGAALGLLLDWDPLLLASLFSLAVAGALGPAAERAKLEPNVIIGITFPLTMALGLIFLRFAPGTALSSTALGLLWGSVLGVTEMELLELAFLSGAMVVLIALFFKEFLAILLDMKLAREAGLNPRPFYYAILFLTGMTVALSLKLIGGLLVFALMINPAATAFQFLHDMKKIILFSPLIGAGAAALGLLGSFAFDLPVGSAIALVSTAGFGLAVALSPKRRRG